VQGELGISSIVELSCQSPLWWWTHLPPPCALLLPCPLYQGSPWQFSNLGLPPLLLRVALRQHQLPESMSYCPPFTPFLLPQPCSHPLLLPHLIGGIGSHTGVEYVYYQAMWDPVMSSLRTSDRPYPPPFPFQPCSFYLLSSSPYSFSPLCSLFIVGPPLPGFT